MGESKSQVVSLVFVSFPLCMQQRLARCLSNLFALPFGPQLDYMSQPPGIWVWLHDKVLPSGMCRVCVPLLRLPPLPPEPTRESQCSFSSLTMTLEIPSGRQAMHQEPRSLNHHLESCLLSRSTWTGLDVSEE